MGYKLSKISPETFYKGIDLAALVAKRAESLLLGNGYELQKGEQTSDADLEKFTKVMDEQGLIGLLSDVERNLSMYGEQAVVIDYDGNKDVRFSMCDQNSKFYTTTSGKIVGALTFRRVLWGNGSYLIQEKWSINKPKVSTITFGETNEVVPIDTFNNKVTPELQVSDKWDYSTLGRLPIVLFQNLNSVGNTSEADGEHVSVLQDQLDHQLQILYKDTEMSRTRIAINKGNEELVKTINSQGLFSGLKDSIILEDADYNEDGTVNPIYTLEGTFKGEAYKEMIKFYIDAYFDGSGYSTLSDSDAQETVVGVLYTNKKDMETTRKKLKVREAQLEEFSGIVKDLLKLTGESLIKLKPNIMYDEQNKMDYIRSGVEFDVLPELKKIMLYHGITDVDEAKEILKDLEKEREKENEELIENQQLMMNMGNNDEKSDVKKPEPKQGDEVDGK